jgi:hypothetical protein
MWFDILKQPRLKVSPKTFTAFKIPPKEEQEEGDCNKKLKAYADKVRAKKMYLKDGYNSKDFNRWRNWFSPKIDEENEFTLIQAAGRGAHENGFWEEKFHEYNPIPEEVACKALEMLERAIVKDDYDTDWDEEIIDGTTIQIKFSHDYQNTILQLLIYGKSGVFDVNIGYYIAEYVTSLSEGMPSIISPDPYNRTLNIFNVLGYYKGQGDLDWR